MTRRANISIFARDIRATSSLYVKQYFPFHQTTGIRSALIAPHAVIGAFHHRGLLGDTAARGHASISSLARVIRRGGAARLNAGLVSARTRVGRLRPSPAFECALGSRRPGRRHVVDKHRTSRIYAAHSLVPDSISVATPRTHFSS